MFNTGFFVVGRSSVNDSAWEARGEGELHGKRLLFLFRLGVLYRLVIVCVLFC